MAHLFLIAGHGDGDPGACGNGYTEAERVRALAARVKALGGDNVTLGDTSRDWYKDKLISTLSIPEDWQIAEFHMDSSPDASPHGGHIIIKSGYSPDAYDTALANFIGGMLPGRAQLIVGRSDLLNPQLAAAKGYSYRLIEFGFITNANDVSIFNDQMDDIARGVLSAFGIGSSESDKWVWDNNKNEIFQKYLTLLDQLRPAMDRQPNLLFSAAVSWWYSKHSAEGQFDNGRGYDLVNDKRLHMLVPMIYWEDKTQAERTDKVIERASYYIHDGADTCAGIRVDEHKNFDQAVADIQSGLSGESDTKEHFHGVVVFANRYFTDWPPN